MGGLGKPWTDDSGAGVEQVTGEVRALGLGYVLIVLIAAAAAVVAKNQNLWSAGCLGDLKHPVGLCKQDLRNQSHMLPVR